MSVAINPAQSVLNGVCERLSLLHNFAVLNPQADITSELDRTTDILTALSLQIPENSLSRIILEKCASYTKNLREYINLRKILFRTNEKLTKVFFSLYQCSQEISLITSPPPSQVHLTRFGNPQNFFP